MSQRKHIVLAGIGLLHVLLADSIGVHFDHLHTAFLGNPPHRCMIGHENPRLQGLYVFLVKALEGEWVCRAGLWLVPVTAAGLRRGGKTERRN